MRHARRFVLVSVLLVCVGCDRAAKWAAVALLEPGGARSFAGETVRFEIAYNPGAFLGLGAALPPAWRSLVLLGAVPVAFALVLALVLRAGVGARRVAVAIGLLAGGGLGNWIDRVLHGGLVTDFVSLGVGPLRTGIFNVADVAIVAGALLLAVSANRDRVDAAAPPADG